VLASVRYREKNREILRKRGCVGARDIELPAKLLGYFSSSNKKQHGSRCFAIMVCACPKKKSGACRRRVYLWSTRLNIGSGQVEILQQLEYEDEYQNQNNTKLKREERSRYSLRRTKDKAEKDVGNRRYR